MKRRCPTCHLTHHREHCRHCGTLLTGWKRKLYCDSTCRVAAMRERRRQAKRPKPRPLVEAFEEGCD